MGPFLASRWLAGISALTETMLPTSNSVCLESCTQLMLRRGTVWLGTSSARWRCMFFECCEIECCQITPLPWLHGGSSYESLEDCIINAYFVYWLSSRNHLGTGGRERETLCCLIGWVSLENQKSVGGAQGFKLWMLRDEINMSNVPASLKLQ